MIERNASAGMDIFDITADLSALLSESGLKEGVATVFVPGSTGAVTTVEHEPGLVHDLHAFFERIIPRDMDYGHEQMWHDGNGHSHVRASLLGPSLSVPFKDGGLVLGTWQQVILIDFDNKPRTRKVVVNFMGE